MIRVPRRKKKKERIVRTFVTWFVVLNSRGGKGSAGRLPLPAMAAAISSTFNFSRKKKREEPNRLSAVRFICLTDS